MKLKLPEGDFRAYLFDCDGTIADSMPLHYKAWKKALAEYGCTYDEDLFYSWGGKPVRKIIADLNEIHGLNMPVDTLAEYKEKLYHAQLPELQGIPEVIEHIEAQHGRIPFAVVSGSRPLSQLFELAECADRAFAMESSYCRNAPRASSISRSVAASSTPRRHSTVRRNVRS